jgi:hypothetical protein
VSVFDVVDVGLAEAVQRVPRGGNRLNTPLPPPSKDILDYGILLNGVSLPRGWDLCTDSFILMGLDMSQQVWDQLDPYIGEPLTPTGFLVDPWHQLPEGWFSGNYVWYC